MLFVLSNIFKKIKQINRIESKKKKKKKKERISCIERVNFSGIWWSDIKDTVLSYAGEGNGNPLQYSCLENPMDRWAWWAAVHGVARSRTRLSDFTLTFHFHALEKEMATHSSVLAWRIPGTGEPGGLPSLGSQSRTWLKWLSSSSSFPMQKSSHSG